MTEHAVFIPTSFGPIGGIVHEPGGEPRAALAFLPGAGPAGRSGVNSVWARTARAISELGVTTLRVEYPGTRESFVARGSWGGEHLSALHEALAAFRSRAADGVFFLAGSCYGARLAFQLVIDGVDARELGIIIPEGNHPDNPSSNDWNKFDERYGARTQGPAELFPHIRGRAALWALVGERNAAELLALKKSVDLDDETLDVEVIPRAGAHAALLRSADAQEGTIPRFRAWVARSLER